MFIQSFHYCFSLFNFCILIELFTFDWSENKYFKQIEALRFTAHKMKFVWSLSTARQFQIIYKFIKILNEIMEI